MKVALEDGSLGLGECPTSVAFRNETVPVVRGLIAGWSRGLKGMSIEDWGAAVATLRKVEEGYPMAVSGLETALFRAFLATKGLDEHLYWGGRLRQIETDITIPFIPGNEMLPGWVDYAVRKGFRIFKVKVSGHVTEDMKFLSGLCRAVTDRVPGFTIRLDGNQGYSPGTFLQMADYIEKAGYAVELFEQPLPKDDYKGLKEIRGRSSVPVILDETVVTAEQAKRVVDEDLCDGVNIKTAKSGIRESLNIMTLVKGSGLKLMIGCMTETMVGLSAGIHLAAGSGNFDYIDLDGIYFLHHRGRYGSIEISAPWFFVGEQDMFSKGFPVSRP